MNGLTAEIEVGRGSFSLKVDFSVSAGTVLAVLGPNGSGKSTILSCLAGLTRADRATITLFGRVLADSTKELPAHARRVGLIPQEPSLFPYLSVVDNVAFAPRARGSNRRNAREVANTWLAKVFAVDLAQRKPSELSGGQAQRVALARALADEPDLLLLDEPFAALDVETAPVLRGLVRRTLRDFAGDRVTLLVTHDPLDALVLADQVIVLEAGRIVECGLTSQVLTAPKTSFTARLAGLNLIVGTATVEGLRTSDGHIFAGIVTPETQIGEKSVAVFLPTSVALYPHDARLSGSPRNWEKATVLVLEPTGSTIRVQLAADRWPERFHAEVTPAAAAELRLEPGSRVQVAVKATTVTVYSTSH